MRNLSFRDQISVLCIGSMHCKPLDHQGSSKVSLFQLNESFLLYKNHDILEQKGTLRVSSIKVPYFLDQQVKNQKC